MSEHPTEPQVPGDSDRLAAKCFWITILGVIAFAAAVYILVPSVSFSG